MSTSLRLYDNYTRSLRAFEPLQAGAAGLYTCGPTVYDYQHIGNFRTFLFEDILKRVLEWNGYRVRHVMNVTDVGHLTSDADTGEDKMEKGARRTGRSAWEIAELYTAAFIDDMQRLNIEPPTVLCRATDHIGTMLELIGTLESKQLAYRASNGDVNFAVRKLAGYGKLSGKSLDQLRAGERVAVLDGKEDPLDFVLWKSAKESEPEDAKWDSEFGRGRPG